MYQRIIVPIDGSETSNKALVAALQLAKERQGRIRLVHVVEELAYLTGYDQFGGYSGDLIKIMRETGTKVLADGTAIAQSAGVRIRDRSLRQFRGAASGSGRGRGPALASRPDRGRHPWPARRGPHPAGQRCRTDHPHGAGAGAGHSIGASAAPGQGRGLIRSPRPRGELMRDSRWDAPARRRAIAIDSPSAAGPPATDTG